MPQAVIELVGEDVLCGFAPAAGAARELRVPVAEALERLRGWSARYDAASRRDREAELRAIGGEMFAWLDADGWASAWAGAAGDPPALEVRAAGAGAEAEALLDAPWELLADGTGPLALNALRVFVVARRIGAPGPGWAPRHADLRLMFMAASPEGRQVVDFEAEEAAILAATKGLPLQLVVEESGAAEFLGRRLSSAEGPFEALHLSCHGTIDARRGPVLALETAEGGEDRVGPEDIARALGPDAAPLVFLSSCRGGTGPASQGAARREGLAEAPMGWEGPDALRDLGGAAAAPDVTTPFARRLVEVVPNVLGWDGSVYDRDATEFAEVFYHELARKTPAPRAAAMARQRLLQALEADPERRRGRHWHLARVYLGPTGGGPLCDDAKPRRRRAAALGKTYLDNARRRVPVATAAEFVGRRRRIQKVLAAFRADRAGVLVHGMGAIGKSSLAARVASRMPLRPVVIYERYDARAIFDEVLAALPPAAQREARAAWRETVEADPAALGLALQDWLEGPLTGNAAILMIMDDLERILRKPAQSDAPTTVAKEEHRAALAAVLEAFDRTATDSKLLITCRHDFSLPDGQGGDHADILVRVPLVPMEERDRIKQWRAAERVTGREAGAEGEAQALLADALAAAAGNPGLQEVLTRPLLKGELEPARAAIAAVGHFRETGVPPAEIQALIDAGAAQDDENALVAFFRRLSFRTYRDALTEGQARQLTAATLFDEGVPIPCGALEAAGAAQGVEAPDRAIARLLGLGLLDDHGGLGGTPHVAANPLARPLAPPLDPADRPRLARAALGPLAAAWRSDDGAFPADPRGVAAARLALEAGAEPELLDAAVRAGAGHLYHDSHDAKAALGLLRPALAALEAAGAIPTPGLLGLAARCAERVGDPELRRNALARALETTEHPWERAVLLVEEASRLIDIAAPEAAEPLLKAASVAFERLGDLHQRAGTLGKIADVLQARGEIDEALRIRREEQLPVYERLGDMRGRAATMGRIADVLRARGELDEALRIRREEQLPVFERLGDVRERAVTLANIADVQQARGELDEALRIRREVLPIFERLGDVRACAITRGKIADVLQARGELDEALRIRREEELPVYERLGDVRARAATMGKVADVLHARGELDEALRIRREEELPVYERLGDVHGRSITLQKIAAALIEQGGLDDERADEIRGALEEAYAIARQLGLADGTASVGLLLARVLARLHVRERALEVLAEAEAAYARLGHAEGLEWVRALRAALESDA